MHGYDCVVYEPERTITLTCSISGNARPESTHHFLTEQDIAALHPLVAGEFASDAISWWVVVDEADLALGFWALRTT